MNNIEIKDRFCSIQVIRFGVIGAASNFFIYIIYILLTLAGLQYEAAMTLCFVAGVLFTFNFNKSWTFSRLGLQHAYFAKYFVVYAVAYLLNLLGLWLLVDIWAMPHQPVQAAMILFIALIIFIAQKYWVFFPRDRS